MVGLQLQEKKHDRGIDRAAAVTEIHWALLGAASRNDMMRNVILDVVCSKADKEQTSSRGVTKASATFYVRLPAFVG